MHILKFFKSKLAIKTVRFIAYLGVSLHIPIAAKVCLMLAVSIDLIVVALREIEQVSTTSAGDTLARCLSTQTISFLMMLGYILAAIFINIPLYAMLVIVYGCEFMSCLNPWFKKLIDVKSRIWRVLILIAYGISSIHDPLGHALILGVALQDVLKPAANSDVHAQ